MEYNWKIALMAQRACILEVDAPKVGNVNRFHDFEDTSLEDFHFSALAIGRPFGYIEQQGVGKTIAEAVKATREVVATNTNLGIVLLLAPLGMAWCRGVSHTATSRENSGFEDTAARRFNPCEDSVFVARISPSCRIQDSEFGKQEQSFVQALKREIKDVLKGLSAEDTYYVYQAIRLASPKGMGEVQQYDVWREDIPRIPLLEAMRPAANRDLIAQQYNDDFALVLGAGYETLNCALAQGLALPQAIAHTHLILLSMEQDSLIKRKLGEDRSKEVQKRALFVREQGGWLTRKGRKEVQEFDLWLRQEGHRLNPGTTADLMAAIIFVHLLEKDWKMKGVEGSAYSFDDQRF